VRVRARACVCVCARVCVRSGIPSNVFQYKFKTIVDATKNFSPDHLIGCGDFGAVYHGRITNTVYAIKKMYKVELQCYLQVFSSD